MSKAWSEMSPLEREAFNQGYDQGMKDASTLPPEPAAVQISHYYLGGADRRTIVLVDTQAERVYTLDELNALLAAAPKPGGMVPVATWEESNRCYLEQFDRAEQLQREVNAKQAHIDRLMLEYCPDEMTPEQIENWKRHQVAAPKPEGK
jgi:hypothetical protein